MKETQGLSRFQEASRSELRRMLDERGIAFPERSDREDYVAAMKTVMQTGRETVRRAHLAGAGGAEVVYGITGWTDAVLRELFRGARRLLKVPEAEVGCALLSIGGYGRGELNPYSDLDVMFLTPGRIDAASRSLSEACLYLMWDLNLDVGHSIRSIADCEELAAADIRAKTSLLESRFLAGNRKVYERFRETSRRTILRRDADHYLRTKMADVQERKKRYGRSLYLKEPQVKEGVGGLRDIHTAFWIAKVKFGVDALRDLRDRGVISEKEDRILRRSREFLWRVRNHMHFVSGRRNDLLSMDLQETLAAFFGYKDVRHYLAVERFMRVYYLQTRNVRDFTTLLMSRCAPLQRRRGRSVFSLRKRHLEDGLTVIANRLCLPPESRRYFRAAPERLMEVFYVSQRYHVPLSDGARQAVLASLSLVDDAFRRSERVRGTFLRILSGGNGVVKTLRQMHECRFLGRYLPEFGALTALVQHELYHAYTVDEHTLFALEKLEALRGSPYGRDRFYAGLLQEVRRPAILFLALLLHDIGKAMGPGHVERGGDRTPYVLGRMGLAAEDVETVQFLVRNHLVPGHLSQRRDIHEPSLVEELARSVGDEERLRMLTLICYCDTSAVGPGIWNDWKDTLLQELFWRTRDALREIASGAARGGLPAALEQARTRAEEEIAALCGEAESRGLLERLPEPYLLATPAATLRRHISMIERVDREGLVIAWDTAGPQGYVELNLCTYDSDTPGLFSRIAGVLAARRINILGARIFTCRDGLVIDCVQVDPPAPERRRDPEFWEEVSGLLGSVLQGRRRVEEVLRIHEPPPYLRRKRGRSVPPRVLFDNEVSPAYTVMEVHAADRVGLLYDMTSCLAAAGVHIHSAKVTTEADRAVDAFYVTDIFGHKIRESEKLERIRKRLEEVLKGRPPERPSASFPTTGI